VNCGSRHQSELRLVGDCLVFITRMCFEVVTLCPVQVILQCVTLTKTLPLSPVQDCRNDLPSCERQCTSISVIILHAAETPVKFLQLAVPLISLSTVGKWAFPVSGANFWRSLPPQMTSAPSLAKFRQCLKTFLFHLSYPDIVS